MLKLRIMLSQLSTKMYLKLKLSLVTSKKMEGDNLGPFQVGWEGLGGDG